MKKILLTLFLLIFISCENEEIINPEIGFEEYSVVQAEIRPEEFFPSVRFTKTLPLGVPYDISKAELKNVTAYILKNEIQIIPLLYDSDGLYKPKYGFYVQSGETYELFAEVNGKFIYAKTIVPYKPEIVSTHYNSSEFRMEADIKTNLNEVYSAIWIISGLPPAKADDFYSVTNSTNETGTIIKVNTAALPDEFRDQTYSENRYIQVYSFDQSFKDYFYSRTASQEINDPFIQGGGAVKWNVQGEKVIGMFIGLAEGMITKVN